MSIRVDEPREIDEHMLVHWAAVQVLEHGHGTHRRYADRPVIEAGRASS